MAVRLILNFICVKPPDTFVFGGFFLVYGLLAVLIKK